MARVIYLHGYGSSPNGDYFQILKENFPQHEIIGVPTNMPFVHIAEAVQNLLTENTILLGRSLGGFYAACLSHRFEVDTILVNPSLRPHITLLKSPLFDGDMGLITELESVYNTYIPSLDRFCLRLVILCKDDEVLDHSITAQLLSDHSAIVYRDNGGHRYHGVDEIRQVLG